MWKKSLILILVLSLVFEAVFSVAGFIAPTFVMEQLKISATPDTAFLGFVIAWLLLFVTLICGLSLKLVLKGDPLGWLLATVLGLWWVGIGLGIYLGFQRPDNLALDSIKGALILLTAWGSWPGRNGRARKPSGRQ